MKCQNEHYSRLGFIMTKREYLNVQKNLIKSGLHRMFYFVITKLSYELVQRVHSCHNTKQFWPLFQVSWRVLLTQNIDHPLKGIVVEIDDVKESKK